MDRSQNNSSEWNKPEKEIAYFVWFHFYEILENAN